ncbi:MAG TPA: hypothetical protein PK646_00015 [Bacillota bacterium]|jgi:hypothetical protein|nr:hypothetical protein [Fastidiosipila sp.]HPX93392.1 hypothetical protein [Bacillota bacterium]HQB80470.1 hypothetical protein [Bacillota bacterium]
MKRVLILISIVLLLLVIAVGGVWAQKTDEEAEPTATLLSSTNTDDEGIGGNMFGEDPVEGAAVTDIE